MAEYIIEWSKVVFSNDDLDKLREALKKAPILNEIRGDDIINYKDYLQGNLDQVLSRLTDYMQQNSKRPDFSGFRANWVDKIYVNVSTWFNRPNTAATVFSLLIIRMSDDGYCLFA
jgi:hypothetical protein